MVGLRKTREEKARDRREAILEAALKEFTARGFSDTRIEDVARRAGVAKGTIYLHFADKEALFEGVVRSVVQTDAATRDAVLAIPEGFSVRQLLETYILASAGDFATSRMADVIRLLVSEGLRFPHLIAFYRDEMLTPLMERTRALLEEARRRGELRSDDIVAFPMLLGSPMLLGAIWHGMIADRGALDVLKMMQAFIDALFRTSGDTGRDDRPA